MNKLVKWKKHCDIIYNDVQQLLITSDIFWSTQSLIKENNKIQSSNIFCTYLGDTYVSHISIGIRRQAKNRSDSISLHRLLSEIKDTPQLISKEYYLSLFNINFLKENRQGINDDFDEKFSNGKDYISADIVDKDIDKLKKITEKCTNFTNKIVAHIDEKQPEIPKFLDLKSSLDILEKLVLKYMTLFDPVHMDSLMPTFQDDWQEVFDHPWRINNSTE